MVQTSKEEAPIYAELKTGEVYNINDVGLKERGVSEYTILYINQIEATMH